MKLTNHDWFGFQSHVSFLKFWSQRSVELSPAGLLVFGAAGVMPPIRESLSQQAASTGTPGQLFCLHKSLIAAPCTTSRYKSNKSFRKF